MIKDNYLYKIVGRINTKNGNLNLKSQSKKWRETYRESATEECKTFLQFGPPS